MKLLSSINENTDIVDKKYVDDAVSDVQEQVSATKYWANVAVSSTSSNTTKPKFSPDFEINLASNTVIGSATNKAIASPLTKYLWHDIISFGANGHPTVSKSTDGGATWTTLDDANLQKKLFIQREDQTITVLDDSKPAIRWNWYSSSFHACQAAFLNIGFAYSAKGATFNILWETSTDGTTWTTGFTQTGAKYGSAPYWFYITTNWANAYWVRLTLTRTSGEGTSTNLSGIKLLTTRWGNQGRGSEWEVPYVWDYAQNIYPRVSDAATLGTSSYKWSNVYATKFTGALEGNADTATSATTATNLASAPSLAASGNNITVTAGGKTSSVFTVPYATSAGSTTSATTATNLTNAPSLTASGDKIKVTIGDKSSSELTVPYATKAKGDSSGNDISTTYAKLASPALTGTPTAPTAASGTNTTQIATTAFVVGEINSKLAASDAMQFKGTLGTGGTITALPATHSKGDTYKVITAGTYAGVACEVGDMIICITDGTSANNAHWTVVQSNIDGAVTGPTSSVANNIPVFSGTTGKVIKDSGVAVANILPKTTYEWNKEISFGSSGKLCVGKFVMYDSAVVVEINATTNTTYHATLVIATQNHGTSSGGNIKATVYGDATNTITPNIKIYSHPANDGLVEVYFSPTAYSKNLVHIQAQGLTNRGTVAYDELAFDICTSITAIPSTATLVPTNALTENFASKSVATTSANGLMSAADKAKLDSNITIAGNAIGLGGSVTADTLKASLGLENVTNTAASGYFTSLTSGTTNAVSITIGGTTKNITAATLKSSLGLGSLAYMSALSTNKQITLTATSASDAHIEFSRESYNYITFPSSGYLAFGNAPSGVGMIARIATSDFSPYTNNTKTLGTSDLKWNAVYATTFHGALEGNAKTATSATSATKATQDGSGNVITSYYATLSTAQTISGAKTFTDRLKIQNGDASGSFVLGADVNAKTLTANVRKLGRMGVPSYDSTTKTMAGISFDSQANANYADFGGHPNNASSIAPDVIRFVVANAHDNTINGARTLALQISKQNGLVDTSGGGTSVAAAKFFIPVQVASNLSATGTITSTGGFVGDLTGNASSASDASKLGGQSASYYASASSLSSYLPLAGGTITGTTNIKTNAGTAPLVIMRNAAAEATSIYQSDTGLHFDVVNDEKSANISIKLKATDTENSTGVDAGEATVTISGSKSGSSITATTFSGNATTATTASKLSTVSKTAWGQTFWTSDGVPATISGNMTGVGSISANGDITTSAGLLKSTKNGNTLTIGSQNSSWCHFANSADIKFHFNKEVHSAGGFKIYNTSHGLSSAGALTAATGSFSSTLSVTSTSTFTGKTTHNGGLSTTTLSASGAATLSSTLAVTSTSTFTGKTTHNGGIGTTTLAASGATTLSSTLAVTGASTFTGATTHNGGVTIAANKNLQVGTSVIIYNSTTGCLEITV